MFDQHRQLNAIQSAEETGPWFIINNRVIEDSRFVIGGVAERCVHVRNGALADLGCCFSTDLWWFPLWCMGWNGEVELDDIDSSEAGVYIVYISRGHQYVAHGPGPAPRRRRRSTGGSCK